MYIVRTCVQLFHLRVSCPFTHYTLQPLTWLKYWKCGVACANCQLNPCEPQWLQCFNHLRMELERTVCVLQNIDDRGKSVHVCVHACMCVWWSTHSPHGVCNMWIALRIEGKSVCEHALTYVRTYSVIQ